MSVIVYNHFLATESIPGLTSATVKILLLDATYTPNKDHDFRSELTGVIAGSTQTITGITVTEDDPINRALIDHNDVAFTSITASVRYAVAYIDHGSAAADTLFYCIDFETTYALVNDTLTVQPPTGGILSTQQTETETNTDVLVKVSSNDTTAGYLNGKLVPGTNITLVENNDGGNETLTINSTASPDLSGYFKLDQTTPQEVINGVPNFKTGLAITDPASASAYLSITNSNGAVALGSSGYILYAQLGANPVVYVAESTKAFASSGFEVDYSGNVTGSNLSGTNTGDQDLSGYQLISNNLLLEDVMSNRVYLATPSRIVDFSSTSVGTINLELGTDKQIFDGITNASIINFYSAGASLGYADVNFWTRDALAAKSDGDVLTWNDTTGVWEAKASAGGAVDSVSNVDGTLTISPTTGAVVASLNLGNANTWTAKQTIQLTTEQFRLGYDASNYTNFLVSSVAGVTTDIVGTTPTYTWKFAGTERGYWKPSSTQFYFGTTGSANSGTGITVIGQSNTIHATKNSINVFGNSNTANMANSVVVGRSNTLNDTTGTGDGSIVIGSGNTMNYQRGVVVGRDCTATGSAVVVLGYGCSATGNNSMTLGINCTNTVTNTIKIGLDANNAIGFTNTGVFTLTASAATQFTVSSTGVVTAKGLNIAGASAATLASFDQASTGTLITTPFPAFELVNTNATVNNFVTFSFADAVGGASYALMGGKCIDHTNNYGEYHVWTRGTSGGATRMEIGSNGGMTVTVPTDANLSAVTAIVPTSATTFGGTYAGLSLANTNTTNGNFARLDFLDVVNGTSSANIFCKFVNHTTKEGNMYFRVYNGTSIFERVSMLTLETVINDDGANLDFRVEGDTNANLIFVDASADLVGMGTNAPLARLDVRMAGNNVAYFWNTAASSSSGGAGLQGFHNDGAAMASGDRLGFLTLAGAVNGAGDVSSGSAVTSFATENFGATYGSDLRFETTLTGASSRASRLTIDGNADFNFFDGSDFILGTTTGTKIGTSTSQKIGFYNATPIVQGASVADATGGVVIDAEARTAINALISRIEALGLIATV